MCTRVSRVCHHSYNTRTFVIRSSFLSSCTRTRARARAPMCVYVCLRVHACMCECVASVSCTVDKSVYACVILLSLMHGSRHSTAMLPRECTICDLPSYVYWFVSHRSSCRERIPVGRNGQRGNSRRSHRRRSLAVREGIAFAWQKYVPKVSTRAKWARDEGGAREKGGERFSMSRNACTRVFANSVAVRPRLDSKNVTYPRLLYLRKIIVPIICWVASETLKRQCNTSVSLSNFQASFGLISLFESIAHRYN